MTADPLRGAPAGAPLAFAQRAVADASDRVEWLRARSAGVTATDVAKLSSPRSLAAVLDHKLHGTGFTGNPYTEHGKAREPVIAAWVRQHFGIESSTTLYHAVGNPRHLATPDGIGVNGQRLELAEIKTTSKPWRRIPRHYLRQVWWQQYVLGAERTLVVWEVHDNFVPVSAQPECQWVERDDDQIAALIGLADSLLQQLGRHRSH